MIGKVVRTVQSARENTALMSLEEPNRVTRTEEIRKVLADDIVLGRLPPGLALDESELARKFGVSRTPIREAIRQLEATGLAEARPRRGAVVAPITKRRLDEMFLVMLELEAICARDAALKMGAQKRSALVDIHERSAVVASKGDVEGYYRCNDDFHDAIYHGGDNLYLVEMTTTVRKRVAPFRRVQFMGAGRLPRSYEEHGAIVEAIMRGDGPGAEAAMRAHIATVRSAYDIVMPDYAI